MEALWGPVEAGRARSAGCRQAMAARAAVAACWAYLEAGQGRAGGLPRQAGGPGRGAGAGQAMARARGEASGTTAPLVGRPGPPRLRA